MQRLTLSITLSPGGIIEHPYDIELLTIYSLALTLPPSVPFLTQLEGQDYWNLVLVSLLIVHNFNIIQ